MTEAAFGRFTYNQYEGTSILAGGRKVEVLLPPVTLSLGVVQNRKNEWLEVEVLLYYRSFGVNEIATSEPIQIFVSASFAPVFF